MMLQVGDGGVVSAVNEDDLIYVDKNELDAFVEEYNHLKEEKEQQQKSFDGLAHNWKIMYDEAKQVISDLEKENEQLRKDSTVLILANQDYRRENDQLKQEIENLQEQLAHIDGGMFE